jgi:hypothetical protein
MNALLHRIVRRSTVWIVTLSVLSACLLSARACQTPVYRYAMYKWSRAPYEVIYIHDGKQEDQDKAVNAVLRALAEDDKKPVANLRFSTFDASNKTQIESAFPAIKERSTSTRNWPDRFTWSTRPTATKSSPVG